MLNIILIIIVVILLVCSGKEKMTSVIFEEKINQEPQGPWEKNISATVSPDFAKSLVLLGQQETKRVTNICVYPIDTLWLHIFNNSMGDTMYKWRNIFFAQGKQSGFEVDFIAYAKSGSEDLVMVSMETNEAPNAVDPIRPFPTTEGGDYFSYDKINTHSVPSLEAFNKYVKAEPVLHTDP